MKTSNRFDYLSPAYEMDLTDLDRLPTDTGIALIDRLNAELNAQSERLEDIFIEIACENMDNPRKCAFYKELRKVSSLLMKTVSQPYMSILGPKPIQMIAATRVSRMGKDST